MTSDCTSDREYILKFNDPCYESNKQEQENKTHTIFVNDVNINKIKFYKNFIDSNIHINLYIDEFRFKRGT